MALYSILQKGPNANLYWADPKLPEWRIFFFPTDFNGLLIMSLVVTSLSENQGLSHSGKYNLLVFPLPHHTVVLQSIWPYEDICIAL